MDEKKAEDTHGPGDGTGLDADKIEERGQQREAEAAAGPRPTAYSEEWLEEVFSYHSPDADQRKAYHDIRLAGRILVENIIVHAPICADRSAAIRKVREAVMTANAAIALRGLV
jgi:hypothetical protein